MVTVVKQLKEKHKSENPIYLNAGDSFQGTVWYNFFRWNVTSHFLNLLQADAMVKTLLFEIYHFLTLNS